MMCGNNTECSCCKKPVKFIDRVHYDAETRECISLRDGVYDYLGLEIGRQPYHKVFKIYRSPETVKELNEKLVGLPLTNEHVSLDYPPSDSDVVGKIETSDVVDLPVESLAATVGIKNKLTGVPRMLELLESGKRELSLGFGARLIPHNEYDFEQVGFEPHHLAMLKDGRCGPICKFQDGQKQGIEMKITKTLLAALQPFTDGVEITLQQILELFKNLPDMIRMVPVDQLQEVAPVLMDLLESARQQGVEIEMETPGGDVGSEPGSGDDGEQMTDGTALGDLIDRERGDVSIEEIAQSAGRDPNTIENIISGNIKTPPREVLEGIAKAINVDVERLIDALPDDKEGEVQPTQDGDGEPSDDEKLKMADGKILFNDAMLKKSIDDAIKEHSQVVEKARKFVDENFDFSGKTTDQIRAEVLEIQGYEKFTDSNELKIAYKLLKETSKQSETFGDSGRSTKLLETANKEL